MLVLPGAINRGLRVNEVSNNDSHGALFVVVDGAEAKKSRHTNTATRQTTRHAKTSHVLQPRSARRHVVRGRLIDGGLCCLVTTSCTGCFLRLEDVMDVEQCATPTQPRMYAFSSKPGFDCRCRQRPAFGDDTGYLFNRRHVEGFWGVC